MPSPVIVPKLPPLLTQCGSCIVFRTTETAVVDWARANEGNFRMSEGSGREELWADLAVDLWKDDQVHFHVERARSEFSNIPAERCGRDGIVKKITEIIALVQDISLCIRSRATICVPESDLPESGIICRLLRTQGIACGVPLSLAGGYLDLDDGLFTKISFSAQKDVRSVHVTLDYQSEDILGDEFLLNADRIAKTGADCFVFERITPEVSSAS